VTLSWDSFRAVVNLFNAAALYKNVNIYAVEFYGINTINVFKTFVSFDEIAVSAFECRSNWWEASMTSSKLAFHRQYQ